MNPNQKRTLSFLVVGFLLCVGLLEAVPVDEPSNSLQPILPSVEATDVVQIGIEGSGGSALLHLEQGKWNTRRHIGDRRRAEGAINQLLNVKVKGPIKVEGITVDTVVSLTTAQGAVHTLQFGQRIPGGSGVYLQAAGGTFATDRLPFNEPVLDLDHFRSRRIFENGRSRIQRIRLTGKLNMDIQNTRFGWVMEQPNQTMPADRESIDGFLDTLFDLRFDSFTPLESNDSTPAIRVELFNSDGESIGESRLSMEPPWLASLGEAGWLPITSGMQAWQNSDAHTFVRRSAIWFDPSQVEEIFIEQQNQIWEARQAPEWSDPIAVEILGVIAAKAFTWTAPSESSPLGSLKLNLMGHGQDIILAYTKGSQGHLIWTPEGANFGMKMGLSETTEFLRLVNKLH